jgi:hypothetical protein
MKVKISDKKIDDFHWILICYFLKINSRMFVSPLKDRRLESQLIMMTEREVREKANELTR